MEEKLQKQIDGLFDMMIRVDSELAATQLIVSEFLKYNDEQKEAFEQDIQKTTELIFKEKLRGLYEKDAENTLRIFGDAIPPIKGE